MSHPTINFVSGCTELLGAIQPLWEKLNKHHASVSPHFRQDFSSYSFEQRTANLLKKHEKSAVRIVIAQSSLQPVGYIICAIGKNRVGEIGSIYVDEAFRGQGVGENLMGQALAWLESQHSESKVIDVAVGNEDAYQFYAKFGFYPRVTTLKQKDG